ncbi:oxidoreductase [Paenibacillus brevis]|uniref:Oxidoreductase n=1 Tax=Paenibacillus brevis TaxID=2841508 RepID=A0ABS6FND2_9BACL|nr:oxidoreductase [Paenibacillus brevis]MBU5670997.1 oxidoreductase [Paenibacillus brevis]
MSHSGKKALIIGATGLVGRELLTELLRDEQYEAVYAIVRRPLTFSHQKLREIVSDFERLEEISEAYAVEDVFCCLGTTIKKARTREAMYRIDVTYPLTVAKLAKEQGARHFLVISSAGADAKSKIWYTKMKGELEQQLKSIGYKALSILHPSLLLGEREEHRLMEKISGSVVRGLFQGIKKPVPAQLGIEAGVVARAMLAIAAENPEGTITYGSKAIHSLGSQR